LFNCPALCLAKAPATDQPSSDIPAAGPAQPAGNLTAVAIMDIVTLAQQQPVGSR